MSGLPDEVNARVDAAFDVSARELFAELDRLAAFEGAVRAALDAQREGFTAAGMTLGEVVEDVATAVRQLDEARGGTP